MASRSADSIASKTPRMLKKGGQRYRPGTAERIPLGQPVQRLDADNIGVQIQECLEGSSKGPGASVHIPGLAPEDPWRGHDRHLERVVLIVEIVSGNKHDGNFQADLLDACYEN